MNYWTNVQWFRTLLADRDADGRHQVVFYMRGLGTLHHLDRLLGGALGEGVDYHILDGYLSICDNYCKGDKISIFGFSRGAVAARALAGMIDQCGLLKADYMRMLPDMWEYYLGTFKDKMNSEKRPQLKNAAHQHVKINCLGVWDTVWGAPTPRDGSLIPIIFEKMRRKPVAEWRYKAHDLRFKDLYLAKNIQRAYHALSINEPREIFECIPWKKREGTARQTVKQVWFAGDHSSVGGGYEDRGLANIALWWMLERARDAGLRFFETSVKKHIKRDLRGMHYDPSLNWSVGGICNRKTSLDGREVEGEKIHVSSVVLHGRKVNLYENDHLNKTVRYSCNIVIDGSADLEKSNSAPILRRSMIEDIDDIDFYLDQLDISLDDLKIIIIDD